MASNRQVAPEDAKSKVCCLRVVFVTSMAFAAAVCGTAAYLTVKSLETDLGVQTYLSVASSALKGAQAITRRKFQACAVFASQHEYAFPNASQWPFVFLPGFQNAGTDLALLSNSVALLANYIVRPEEASEFEDFAQQAYRDHGYPNDTGISGFGFGIWAKPGPSNDRIHDISGNTTFTSQRHILAPILQISNHSLLNALMFNSYSEESRAMSIGSLLDCAEAASAVNPRDRPKCGVVTDFVELITTPGPASILYLPIFPANDPTAAVGLISASIRWWEVLTEIVPDYVDGLYCVISTRSKTYTYVINKGVPNLLGEVSGSRLLSDDHFHSMGRLTSFERRVICTIGPTTDMLNTRFSMILKPTCRLPSLTP
jgi:hypothetical protein